MGESNILGLAVEIAAKPPSDNGFVPVKWRWVNEAGMFSVFNKKDGLSLTPKSVAFFDVVPKLPYDVFCP